MKYVSICSGIEAATVAWHPLGWKPVAFSEIEPFPCAVLKHHYPDVPNLGDMTRCDEWGIENGVDVVVGGTPCQSFSLAGNRGGMDDPRGQLAVKFFDIVRKYKPTWIVWENVPGVLSSNKGRDFGLFLSEMGKCGYGFAYRILDAQYFGVPQRRRRVFVVGYLGDWRPSAAVLFERQSLCRDSQKSGKKRKDSSGDVRNGFKASSNAIVMSSGQANANVAENQSTTLNCLHEAPIVGTWWDGGQLSQTIDSVVSKGQTMPEKNRFPAVLVPNDSKIGCLDSECGASKITHQTYANGHLLPVGCKSFTVADVRRRGTIDLHDTVQTLTSQTKRGDTEPCILMDKIVPVRETTDCLTAAYGTKWNGNGSATNGSLFAIMAFQSVGDGLDNQNNLSPTIRRHDPISVLQSMAVRRLTPRECERLQGFPDDYTAIPWRGRPSDSCPDGPRYKALGNSMAVPVMRWIGQRIEMVSRIIKK